MHLKCHIPNSAKLQRSYPQSRILRGVLAWCFGFFFFGSVSLLAVRSHPDPDLFDGSVSRETANGNEEAMPDAGVVGSPAGEESTEAPAESSPGASTPAQPEDAEAASGAETASSGGSRSFEGLDEIGGQPVNHPGAPSVPVSPPVVGEETSPESGENGDVVAGGSGDHGDGSGAEAPARSFDDLRVGGGSAEERKVEVNRSIQLRPVVEPRTPHPPETGGLTSPGRDRSPDGGGAEIPSGL